MRFTYSRGQSRITLTKTETSKLKDARGLFEALSKHTPVANDSLVAVDKLLSRINEDGVLETAPIPEEKE